MGKPSTSNFEDWLNELNETEYEGPTCSVDNPGCDSCGS